MLAQIGSVPINDIGTDISVPIEMIVTKIAFLCFYIIKLKSGAYYITNYCA